MNNNIFLGICFAIVFFCFYIHGDRITEQQRQYNRMKRSGKMCDENIQGEAKATEKNVRDLIEAFKENIPSDLSILLSQAFLQCQVMLQDDELPQSTDLAKKEDIAKNTFEIIRAYIIDMHALIDAIEIELCNEAKEGVANVSNEINEFRSKKKSYEERDKQIIKVYDFSPDENNNYDEIFSEGMCEK